MTDILSFFGTQKPLFVISELSGDNINRFINREELLKQFMAYIHNKLNCAIIGEQGSGKSSFLLKLLDLRINLLLMRNIQQAKRIYLKPV
ncbi:hypothetical protein MHK_004374 [Candidatus Magnetomorum sp. HK-1]|nr:hypothetical protein MHK_004374 [Candidatus Magnetomorum sp. HK-1]